MALYSLTIKRYNYNESFSTFEEFRRTVKRYFTLRGFRIVEKLTTFPPESYKCDHWERSLKDFTTCAYQNQEKEKN